MVLISSRFAFSLIALDLNSAANRRSDVRVERVVEADDQFVDSGGFVGGEPLMDGSRRCRSDRIGEVPGNTIGAHGAQPRPASSSVSPMMQYPVEVLAIEAKSPADGLAGAGQVGRTCDATPRPDVLAHVHMSPYLGNKL